MAHAGGAQGKDKGGCKGLQIVEVALDDKLGRNHAERGTNGGTYEKGVFDFGNGDGVRPGNCSFRWD